MEKYLKKFARFLLEDEIMEKNKLLKESQELLETLSRERNLYKQRLLKVTEEQEIILKHYRVDNIGADGIPPSYLPVGDTKLYYEKVAELNEVYTNETFRELMAYLLNFHANIGATGKLKNANGDMIDIDTKHIPHMVSAIKSVWELIVGAKEKKKELDSGQEFDKYDILGTADIEEGN